MSDWRPIDTAPRDGTWVLLFCPGLSEERDYDARGAPDITVGCWDAQTYSSPTWLSAETVAEFWDYGGETGAGQSISLRVVSPTRWLPLPASPGKGS